jgi:hypothetical protein
MLRFLMLGISSKLYTYGVFMKKANLFFSTLITVTAFAALNITAFSAEENELSYKIARSTKSYQTNINPAANVSGDVEVEVESEDETIRNVASNPDAVAQSEDVEVFKGDINSLNELEEKQLVKADDGVEAPPSEDPNADEKYQQALHECEQKADESGDFNDSLKKCMTEKGLGDDMQDAEDNVF